MVIFLGRTVTVIFPDRTVTVIFPDGTVTVIFPNRTVTSISHGQWRHGIFPGRNLSWWCHCECSPSSTIILRSHLFAVSRLSSSSLAFVAHLTVISHRSCLIHAIFLTLVTPNRLQSACHLANAAVIFFFSFMLCVCFTSVWILWGVAVVLVYIALVLVVWILWVAATTSVKSTAFVLLVFEFCGLCIAFVLMVFEFCVVGAFVNENLEDAWTEPNRTKSNRILKPNQTELKYFGSVWFGSKIWFLFDLNS